MTQEKSKLWVGLLTGAAIGVGLTLLDRNTREMMVDKTKTTKDTVSQFTSEVRSNPRETKDQLMGRVQEAAGIIKEAANDLQVLYKETGTELADKMKDVQEETIDIVSTTKEAGQDLQQVGEKVRDAKEELVNTEDKKKASRHVSAIDGHAHEYDNNKNNRMAPPQQETAENRS